MKSDEGMAEAIARMIRALGKRCASGDPDSAVYLRVVRSALDGAEAGAVAGWRYQQFSDADIGRELGVTKQAVQKRWPRAVAANVAVALVLMFHMPAHQAGPRQDWSRQYCKHGRWTLVHHGWPSGPTGDCTVWQS